MRSKQLTGSIVALTAALLFATTALANGEPKNQLPFTATVAHDQIAPDWFERYAAAHPYGRNLNQPAPSLVVGEAKNQSPFNSRAATATASLDVFERYAAAHPYGRGITTLVAPETTGEAKSEPPFNRTISAPRAFLTGSNATPQRTPMGVVSTRWRPTRGPVQSASRSRSPPPHSTGATH